MTRDDHSRDHRPAGLGRQGAACRAFLRQALGALAADGGVSEHAQSQHAQSCAFCAERLAAGLTLARALGERPASPPELASRDMLDRVRERIVAQAEASVLGEAIAAGMPVEGMPDAAVSREAGWPEGLLESAVGPAIESPPSVGPLVWRRVQASIYGRVLADTATRRRIWPLGAAGAAAAAVFLMMLLREGTSRPPEIVFTDLATAPNVDFAILRYGAPR